MDSDQTKRLLDKLYDHQRAAFALGCADRVIGIYNALADPHYPTPQKAIDVGWAVVTNQRSADDPIIEAIKAELHEVLPDTETPGMTSVLMAGAAAGMAMLATNDITIQSASFAAFHAIDAVDNFLDGDRDVQAEVAWQQKALNYLSKEPPVSRNMFEKMESWRPRIVDGTRESERYMIHIQDSTTGQLVTSLAVGASLDGMKKYAEQRIEELPPNGVFIIADDFQEGLVVLEGYLENGQLRWSEPD